MAEPVTIGLRPSGGAEVSVELIPERLDRFDLEAGPGAEPWRLAGRLDPGEVESLRFLSGRLGDGRALAVAALRPAGAGGHGDEVVAGLLGPADALERLAAVLLSTEYGPDGLPRRVGLELYETEEAVPLRVAGTVMEVTAQGEEEVRVRAGLELRHGGARGGGIYELRAAR
jgi:hypothetical protein